MRPNRILVVTLTALLALWGAPSSASDKFQDNGDGTVSDVITGLMWQQATASNGIQTALSYCEDMTSAEYDDWRLPQIDELRTTIKYNSESHLFEELPNKGQFWSSTPVASRPGYYWTVSSFTARIRPAHWLNNQGEELRVLSVRCVRGNPDWAFDPSNRLIQYTAETVRDLDFDYIWQRTDDPILRTWDQASRYCDNLELDGHLDWRLPNIQDLVTLIDYTTSEPAIPSEVFPAVAGFYWSSSEVLGFGKQNRAHGVSFDSGSAEDQDKSFAAQVRCVRDGPRPFPDFDASLTNGHYPLQVEFSNRSSGKGIVSYAWDFGDGTTSTEVNPTHTFETPGIFKVKLTALGWMRPVTATRAITVLNRQPRVQITSPVDRTRFLAPADVLVSVNARDRDGYIRHVRFYLGPTLLKTDRTPPYTFKWREVPAGTYEIKAVATDNFRARTTSEPVSVIVRKTANLSLQMSVTPEKASIGQSVNYLISVLNTGPDKASEVSVTDTLPDSLKFISVIPNQGICTKTGNVITCELGQLDIGGSGTVELVASPKQSGLIRNRASVKAPNEADADSTDNKDSATVNCR